MSKADNRKGRSRREICLKLTINKAKLSNLKKKKHHSKQGNVHSKPEKNLTEVLDI